MVKSLSSSSMRKKYIKPLSTAITVAPTASLLLGASSGRTTGDNFSRRQSDKWEEEWAED